MEMPIERDARSHPSTFCQPANLMYRSYTMARAPPFHSYFPLGLALGMVGWDG